MTTLSCDCSCGDYDSYRCYSEIIRKARKPHTCCECGEVIQTGKCYQEATGIDCEGTAFRYRTCIGCANIRAKYCPGGFLFGDLAEQIMDCLGWDYRDSPEEIVCDEDDGPSLYGEQQS